MTDTIDDRIWLIVRRTILFVIGAAGIIYEIVSSGEARPTLLLTDLILIGLIPIDIVITRLTHHAPSLNPPSDRE